MTTSTDIALNAFYRSLEDLASSIEGAWAIRGSAASAFFLNLPIAMFNSVLVHSSDVAVGEIVELHDRMKVMEEPYSLQTRPGLEERVSAIAAAKGLVRQPRDIPFMVVDDGDRITVDTSTALNIRVIGPDELSVYIEALTAGFSMPIEIAQKLTSPRTFTVPGLRLYLGEIEGTPVATGCGVTGYDAVGVFNISTIESERGKGYGAAITAQCAIDGFADGAQVGYLQATELGESVYERMGFTTTERWTVFETRHQGS